jgi:hypothetical protein
MGTGAGTRRSGWDGEWGGLRLRELGERAGGIEYASAGAAVSRFGRQLAENSGLQRNMERINSICRNNEI